MLIDDPDFEHRFPYECRTAHPYDQVVPWCEENFGEFNDRWMRYGWDIAAGLDGRPVKDTYRFSDEQAAILFRLKWS